MAFPQLTYGGVPVPFTVSWTAEDRFWLGRCPWAERLAICQTDAPGRGKPQFGKPHSVRQRRVIVEARCDLCGGPLAARTKVSLSDARVRLNGAEGPAVLQVEPMLHRECATICLRHCPSLKRDVASDTLRVRQVTRYRVQTAIMTAEYVETITGEARTAAGHAKVELLKWIDRDAAWLEAA